MENFSHMTVPGKQKCQGGPHSDQPASRLFGWDVHTPPRSFAASVNKARLSFSSWSMPFTARVVERSIAIMLSERRAEKKHGGDYPDKKSKNKAVRKRERRLEGKAL